MDKTVFVLRTASEVHLKTYFVKQFFLKKLISNLKNSFKKNKIDVKVLGKFSGILILSTDDSKKAVFLMKKFFGIHAFSLAEQHSFSSLLDLQNLFLKFAEKTLSKNDSFALRISRNGKHSFSSQDVAIQCGQKIMDSIESLSVNLSSPKKEIFADIIGKKVFLYSEKISGVKGLPVGVEGKVGLLMEGKKEELVSGFLMLKRGCNIFPVIQKTNQKIEKNLELLSPWNSFQEFRPVLFSELKKEKDFLSALVLSTAKEEDSLKKIQELQNQTSFVVFSPLTFYPKELFKETLELVEK